MRREPLAKSYAQHGFGSIKQITTAYRLPNECRYTSLNGQEPVGGE